MKSRMRGQSSNYKRTILVPVALAGALLILSFLVINPSVTPDISGTPPSERQVNIMSAWIKGLTVHAPIYIDSNSQFTSENGVSSGSGTVDDPYIIENWEINASTTATDGGIDIRNTDKYFVIRNCRVYDGKIKNKQGIVFYTVKYGKIENVTSYNNSFGIALRSSSSNNIITNCSAYNNTYSIYLYSSSNNNITNCYVYNHYSYGIYVWGQSSSNNNIANCKLYTYINYNKSIGIMIDYSSNNAVTNCEVYDNHYVGIYLYSEANNNIITNSVVYNNYIGIRLWTYSNNNQITNCYVYNNYYGIRPDFSSNNNITNCTVSNNSYGIYFFKSQNNALRDNDFWNNTYNFEAGHSELQDFYHNIDTSNIINGKKMYYEIEKNDLVFDGSTMDIGYLGLVSCNNITIKNLNITKSGEGLLLANATNVTVTNSNFSYNDYGIAFHCDHSNNFIEDCKIFSNNFGILFSKSSNNFVKNCEISNNFDGIFINESSNNFVENCKIFSNNFNGVNITGSASYNTIRNCQIFSNNFAGVNISTQSNNFVENCKIFSNNFGVYITQSSNNFIENCDFLSNNFGVYITLSSNNNTIYHNNFINNTNNAYDACSNYWNTTTEGNYWSDYTGSDANSDGIGDTAYNIPGGTNKDNYPLMKPWYAPIFLLEPGWNFVTLPSNTSIQNAEALANAIDNCTHVARWNNITKGLEVHQKGTTENNFTVEGLSGYFVYVSQSSCFNPEGSKTQNLSLSLKQGWNSVGWFNVTNTNAKSLAQNITNCTAISYWNNTLGRFITYVVGTNISNFAIEKGNAYFVFVTSEGTWVNG